MLVKNSGDQKKKQISHIKFTTLGTDHDARQIKVYVVIICGLIDHVIPSKLKFVLSTKRKKIPLVTRKLHLLIV